MEQNLICSNQQPVAMLVLPLLLVACCMHPRFLHSHISIAHPIALSLPIVTIVIATIICYNIFFTGHRYDHWDCVATARIATGNRQNYDASPIPESTFAVPKADCQSCMPPEMGA